VPLHRRACCEIVLLHKNFMLQRHRDIQTVFSAFSMDVNKEAPIRLNFYIVEGFPRSAYTDVVFESRHLARHSYAYVQ
jgi:hypothetical protein